MVGVMDAQEAELLNCLATAILNAGHDPRVWDMVAMHARDETTMAELLDAVRRLAPAPH